MSARPLSWSVLASALLIAALLAPALPGCSDEGVATNPEDIVPKDSEALEVAPADVSPDTSEAGCQSAADCPATKPCHVGSCGSDGVCSETPATDGVVCDDGDGCTTGDTCKGGTCSGPAKVCDDGNPCTTDSCSTAAGGTCVHDAASGPACDDGDPCTKGEACAGGLCTGGTSVCQCKTGEDCKAFDDGDLCNGTQYCDGNACKINPATLVVCSTLDDTACSKNTCAKATGKCSLAPLPDGSACDDANLCTTGDACSGGACKAGTDTCKCQADADCASQDDGDLCNGTMFCNTTSGKCEVNPATVVVCPSVDDSACAKNQCQPKTGLCAMTPVPDGAACDDAKKCTVGDVCKAGKCASGVDTCACKVDADCVKFDDGNKCNGTMFCNVATGSCSINPATVVNCPTVNDTPCSKATCEPKTGACLAVSLPDGATCEADGTTCTYGDACQSGKCQAGAPVCPCKADSDCAGKEDGNLCNGTLFCHKSSGQCQVNPASVVVCPTGLDTPCLQNVCQPATGKCTTQAVHEGQACNADDNLCTQDDVCKSGTCVADTNTCPCQLDGECAGKEDGDLCNGTLYCDKGANVCVVNPKTKVVCPTVDDSECGKNLCQPKSGSCAMVQTADGKPCDDGLLCTVNDVCSQGKCLATAKVCDDKNPCTTDACEASTGACSTTPGPDGGVCSDGMPCTTGDSCKGGTCQGAAKVCDDKNACTTDTCNPTTGSCVSSAGPSGVACDDGKACTSDDKCASGQCKGKIGDCTCGSKFDCDDGDPCTVDACDTLAYKCTHAPMVCDDKKPCTKDACDPKTGQCAFTPDDTASPGGTTCQPDDCSVGTPMCKAGAVTCENVKADPAKLGKACDGGEGICQASGCFVAKAPVIASVVVSGPVKAGTGATLQVVVLDANTDNAKGVNDIAKVTGDFSAIGGGPSDPLTETGPDTDVHGRVFTLSGSTTGLAAGTYSIPLTAVDKSGKSGTALASLHVYTGGVIEVGADQAFKSLSEGLSAAASGDLVLVHDGTYTGTANKNLNPLGKFVTIASKNGAGKTVLDCGGSARAFNLSNPGGSLQVSLQGLTLKNCAASALRVVTAGSDKATVTVTGCVFDGNKNGDVGGALVASGAGVNLSVNASTFKGNLAGTVGSPLDGGAIAFTDGKLTVASSAFTGNTGKYGDALALLGAATGTLTGCTFSGHGGGQRVVSFQGKANLDVTACTFSAEVNAAYCLAGDGESGQLTVSGSRFEGCNIAVVSFMNKTCTISQSVFKGSKNTSSTYGTTNFCTVKDSLYTGNKGIGIYALKAEQSLQNVDFVGNDSGSFDLIVTPASITGGTFSGNKGPTIVNLTNGKLDGVTFTANVTTKATVEVKGTSTVSHCQFIGNQTGTGAAVRGYGGNKGVLSNLLLVGNTGAGQGGGLQFSYGTWTVRNVTAVDNLALQGGGLYAENATVDVFSSIFWNNKAIATKGQGAQVYVKSVSGTAVNFQHCDVRNDGAVAEGDIVDDGLKVNAGDGYVAGMAGNLSIDPLFATAGKGAYFLAQTAAGQAKDSPCVNSKATGVPLASAVGLDKRTTRTDGVADTGPVDAGYHYPP